MKFIEQLLMLSIQLIVFIILHCIMLCYIILYYIILYYILLYYIILLAIFMENVNKTQHSMLKYIAVDRTW